MDHDEANMYIRKESSKPDLQEVLWRSSEKVQVFLKLTKNYFPLNFYNKSVQLVVDV